MKYRIAAIVLVLVSLVSGAASAAEPTRVAVVNPVKVIAQMQERKDLQQKMDNNVRLFEGTLRDKRQKLAEAKNALDALRPGTAQYEEKKEQFIQLDIETAVWAKSRQTALETDHKTQMRTLFDKMAEATAQVAKQKGFDLVLADQAADLPQDTDRLTTEQLNGLLRSRNVIYSDDKIEITADVVAALDASYRAQAAPKK